MTKCKATDQVYITRRLWVHPSQRAVPEKQGQTASERLWYLQTKHPQYPSISSVLNMGKGLRTTTWGTVIREGFLGIASMHKEREGIHTREGNYLWHCKREKKIFFKVLVSLLLCPSVWTYGGTIAIKVLKCARRLGMSWERAAKGCWHNSIYALVKISCQIDVWKRTEIWKTA